MPRSQIEFLRHILDETEYLISASGRLRKEDFLVDEDLTRAFARSIEIIGEASKNVSEDIRDLQDAINWKGMARMRDKLIHHYFGVDYELVWEVVMSEIPQLHSELILLIDNMTRENN